MIPNPTYKNLESLFFPKAVAVIGASNRFGKWGFNLSATLLTSGFRGPVYLINPKEKRVLGRRAFSNLNDLPGPADLAVLAVPALQTIPLIEECGRIGIPNALVVASNFKEVGREGAELEQQLVQVARDHGLTLVGPNTMGMVSTPVGLEILFMPLGVKAGPVDVISQSGNIGLQIMELGMKEGLGFCRFVGSGNEALLGVEDYLAHFGRDQHSRVIVLYLESVRNGERFFEVARTITPHKPILALKAGKTGQGSQAARSHSGAVAQSPKLISDLFKQLGIVEAGSTEELIDLMKTFSLIHPPRGDRLAVVSLGGGWGVTTTDAAALKGLTLPALSPALLDQLNPLLPPFWSRQNPLDLAGSTNRQAHLEVLRILTESEEIDAVVALGMLAGLRKSFSQLIHWKGLFAKLILKSLFLGLLGFLKRPRRKKTDALQKTAGPSKKGGFRIRDFQLWRDSHFMDRVRGLMKTSGKPILLVTFLPGLAVRMTRRFHQPIFGNPERAVEAMSGLMQYGRFLNDWGQGSLQPGSLVSRKETLPEFSDDLSSLDEFQGKKILAHYGIPTVREGIAAHRTEALRLTGEIGYPVALKIHSPNMLHKTDLGGVILNISHEEGLIQSISALEAKFPELHDPTGRAGFLIQEMVTEGVEVLLGMTSDPQFGPLLVLGLGGIMVEVLKDVVFAKPPVTRLQAERLWTSLKGAALLSGFRGRPPADLQALIEATINFSYLIDELQYKFKEIDVNPLMVLSPGKGVKALDALFIKK